MQDLIYQHKVSPQAITTYDEEPSRRVFTEGNALFLRNWSYVWKIANDPKQSKVVDKVAVAPIPAFAGSGNAATLGGYQFGVNRNSKNPDAAVKLIKFLSSEDSQLYFANKINFAPTRPALYKSGKIEDPFLGSLVEVFSGAKARPVTPAYPEVTLVLQAEYSALLANQQTPQQTVTNVAAKVRSILP
jgi:multiple sugar transport system substrate-binding protein